MTLVPASGSQQEAILNALSLNPRDPKVQALALVAERYGLDLLLKQVFLIQGTVYVSHAGLLSVAHRSGQFDGLEIEIHEDDKKWVATARVYRKDMSRPFTYTDQCLKNEKVQDPRKRAITRAERNALRRAFDVGVDVYDETDTPGRDISVPLSNSRPEIPRRSSIPAEAQGEGGPNAPGLEASRGDSDFSPEPSSPSSAPSVEPWRSVVIRCREMRLDDDERHAMVRWATKDRSESAKDLSPKEASLCHHALQRLEKTGERPWRTSPTRKSESSSPPSTESPAPGATLSSESPDGDGAGSAGPSSSSK